MVHTVTDMFSTEADPLDGFISHQRVSLGGHAHRKEAMKELLLVGQKMSTYFQLVTKQGTLCS
jgi:hypothetical protein